LIRANAAKLSIAQQAVSQQSNEMIQMGISPKLPKFGCQNRREEVVRCEFRHTGLDGRAVSLQSRIGLFEADGNVWQTIPVICLQFGEHPLPRSREI
jgi:hypothetical protein